MSGTADDGSAPWQAWPGGRPALAEGEVHVWRAPLDLPSEAREPLAGTLAPDELARAARFRSPRDRDRSVAARGILRALLGRCLDVAPASLRFGYGPHGKPSLAIGGAPAADIRFNVTHAGGQALYAVARGREVGIDLEPIRDLPDADEVAARFFSPREAAALRALPPERRMAGFFACWTRKEAYVKARGAGLALPLASFSVAVDPERPAALLAAAAPDGDDDRWSLHDLRPGAGLAAALAVEGAPGWIIRRRWEAQTAG